ncbi:hypothetical protein LGL55_05785 [Clostridium tagluense]|uniref:hypothetical protein n=1 Tax=Clostridium tagluense TaxID=360422 RepID=UPI001CF1D42A|nr:hypothetical protein [Clostridium tagluense]MCB2310632.1 hypothetical protein [Clostridium tagluense]MCB2315637.1 hypothetical protein [Clostridium tagluense]MCB2320491.1 hypothetical protein [Clostridium tagluense]MCB2325226.1 hypothetical protein [Clostridium tagluense]MCB2330078.1 hypothetical protein [Clostridium tagluense]
MQNFTTILYPILLTILTGFLGYLGKEVVKLAPQLVDFVVAKIGLTNYQKSKLIAMDIWNVTEEHFRLNKIIGDTVQAKVTMFTSLIKQKIPGITDAQIENLRQAVAGEFNRNKPLVIKAIEEAAPIVNVVAVTPILKYVTEDGIELQPVSANNVPVETVAQ